MKRLLTVLCVLGVFCGLCSIAEAEAKWRIPVKLTYVQWVSDFMDNVDADTELVIPVGLSVTPNYEFDWGGQIGFGIGPLAYVSIVGGRSDFSGIDVPLSVWYGQEFIPSASVSPYVRIGAVYHLGLMDMDDVWDPAVGFVVAGGVEFFRSKSIGLLLEVAYDSVPPAVEHADLGGLQVSLGGIF